MNRVTRGKRVNTGAVSYERSGSSAVTEGRGENENVRQLRCILCYDCCVIGRVLPLLTALLVGRISADILPTQLYLIHLLTAPDTLGECLAPRTIWYLT